MRAFAHKESSKDASSRWRFASAETPFAHADTLAFGVVGNTSVQRKPLCPCGGGCPRCGGAIQAKVKIGQPNDVYEQEADRVADQVMRMPEANAAVSNQLSVFRNDDDSIRMKPT